MQAGLDQFEQLCKILSLYLVNYKIVYFFLLAFIRFILIVDEEFLHMTVKVVMAPRGDLLSTINNIYSVAKISVTSRAL